MHILSIFPLTIRRNVLFLSTFSTSDRSVCCVPCVLTHSIVVCQFTYLYLFLTDWFPNRLDHFKMWNHFRSDDHDLWIHRMLNLESIFLRIIMFIYTSVVDKNGRNISFSSFPAFSCNMNISSCHLFLCRFFSFLFGRKTHPVQFLTLIWTILRWYACVRERVYVLSIWMQMSECAVAIQMDVSNFIYLYWLCLACIKCEVCVLRFDYIHICYNSSHMHVNGQTWSCCWPLLPPPPPRTYGK